ncbi:MAG: DUF1080 domain-containing protein [Acidobacteriia bacterium]|nr:DUF1080 domain-containing protein [Terriglobia bacterium]
MERVAPIPTPGTAGRANPLLWALCLAVLSLPLAAQELALDSAEGLELVNVLATPDSLDGQRGLKVSADPEVLQATRERRAEMMAAMRARGEQPRGPGTFEALRTNHLAIVKDSEFGNGTIEVEVSGQPAPGAQGGARGFVGIVWRLQDDRKTYDCFYLRPTNGRADDQERRNHTVQYISHPEWTWFKFRSETPSRYETYADIVPGEWIKVKITVDGEKARIYVNGAEQPTLLVNDVKSGADASGKVALWLEGSTVAHFRNLKITPAP